MTLLGFLCHRSFNNVFFQKKIIQIAGDKRSTRLLIIKSEIWKAWVILPRMSSLGKITRGSHINYYTHISFIATLLKDKCMCLQDKWKLSLILQDKCSIEIFCPLDWLSGLLTVIVTLWVHIPIQQLSLIEIIFSLLMTRIVQQSVTDKSRSTVKPV